MDEIGRLDLNSLSENLQATYTNLLQLERFLRPHASVGGEQPTLCVTDSAARSSAVQHRSRLHGNSAAAAHLDVPARSANTPVSSASPVVRRVSRELSEVFEESSANHEPNTTRNNRFQHKQADVGCQTHNGEQASESTLYPTHRKTSTLYDHDMSSCRTTQIDSNAYLESRRTVADSDSVNRTEYSYNPERLYNPSESVGFATNHKRSTVQADNIVSMSRWKQSKYQQNEIEEVHGDRRTTRHSPETRQHAYDRKHPAREVYHQNTCLQAENSGQSVMIHDNYDFEQIATSKGDIRTRKQASSMIVKKIGNVNCKADVSRRIRRSHQNATLSEKQFEERSISPDGARFFTSSDQNTEQDNSTLSAHNTAVKNDTESYSIDDKEVNDKIQRRSAEHPECSNPNQSVLINNQQQIINYLMKRIEQIEKQMQKSGNVETRRVDGSSSQQAIKHKTNSEEEKQAETRLYDPDSSEAKEESFHKTNEERAFTVPTAQGTIDNLYSGGPPEQSECVGQPEHVIGSPEAVKEFKEYIHTSMVNYEIQSNQDGKYKDGIDIEENGTTNELSRRTTERTDKEETKFLTSRVDVENSRLEDPQISKSPQLESESMVTDTEEGSISKPNEECSVDEQKQQEVSFGTSAVLEEQLDRSLGECHVETVKTFSDVQDPKSFTDSPHEALDATCTGSGDSNTDRTDHVLDDRDKDRNCGDPPTEANTDHIPTNDTSLASSEPLPQFTSPPPLQTQTPAQSERPDRRQFRHIPHNFNAESPDARGMGKLWTEVEQRSAVKICEVNDMPTQTESTEQARFELLRAQIRRRDVIISAMSRHLVDAQSQLVVANNKLHDLEGAVLSRMNDSVQDASVRHKKKTQKPHSACSEGKETIDREHETNPPGANPLEKMAQSISPGSSQQPKLSQIKQQLNQLEQLVMNYLQAENEFRSQLLCSLQTMFVRVRDSQHCTVEVPCTEPHVRTIELWLPWLVTEVALVYERAAPSTRQTPAVRFTGAQVGDEIGAVDSCQAPQHVELLRLALQSSIVKLKVDYKRESDQDRPCQS